MLRQIILSSLLAVIGLSAMASAPKRIPLTMRQSDGTTIVVQRAGDEHGHYYLTSDGVAVMRDVRGRDLVYATVKEGRLYPSTIIAHEANARTTAEITHINTLRRDLQADLQPNVRRHATAASTTDGLGKYGQRSGGVVNSIGKHIIPVIMVQFPDLKFMESSTMEKVSRIFNEDGYNDEDGCKGSVRDYFLEQSNGMFDPTFEVVAIVTASNGYKYYGGNDQWGEDKHPEELTQEAVRLAEAQGVDFSKYVEGDAVPLVSIMHAGEGEHDSWDANSEDFIWAHFADYAPFTEDGIKFSSYFMGNERYKEDSWREARPEGIGLFCHEFSHALGLPDFYGTTQAALDNETPGWWSLMDYGEYWGNGYCPIGYSAYERSYMGWLDIKELGDTPEFVTLYPYYLSDEGNTAYVIRNPMNPNEYYILESRQVDTFYPSNLGHGMLVAHVDFRKSSWEKNTLNNAADHMRYQIVRADNQWQSPVRNSKSLWYGDLFPGYWKVTEFCDDTLLRTAKAFTGDGFDRPLYDITETSDGIITFKYIDANIDGISSPVAAATADATAYTLDGRKVDAAAAQHGIYIVGGKKIVK